MLFNSNVIEKSYIFLHENETTSMKRSPSFTDLVSEDDDKMETEKIYYIISFLNIFEKHFKKYL